jgi:hypothetical protein
MNFSGKFLVLATVLMLVAAPTMADDHLNETDEDSEEDHIHGEDTHTHDDDSDIDGTDNSTEITVSEQEANRIARKSLSNNNWALEESDVDEGDGYYEFEFVIRGQEAEAEVSVDGSSGEIFHLEEELEQEKEDRVEMPERESVQNLERARERITELREQVRELKLRVAELEGERSDLPDEASDRAEEARDREVERDFERDGEDTEVEVEAEDGDRELEVEAEGPNQNAQENVNGTPRSEQAQQRRPGFVSRMLSGFFN